MAKLREGPAFMPADEFSRTLQGFGVNLLVQNIERALPFFRDVVGIEIIHSDPDFAVLRHNRSTWMLHADHTFDGHPLLALTGDGALRGVGIELRLYDLDPDACEKRALSLGYTVLANSADKPHGMRECVIIDADGYAWVPGRMSEA